MEYIQTLSPKDWKSFGDHRVVSIVVIQNINTGEDFFREYDPTILIIHPQNKQISDSALLTKNLPSFRSLE